LWQRRFDDPIVLTYGISKDREARREEGVLALHLARLQSTLACNMPAPGVTSNHLINGLRSMRSVKHLTRSVVLTRDLRWAFHPAASAAQIHRR
jgi:hypothetical protein